MKCQQIINVLPCVPNFVAMATGVGRGRICLASFNSPTPKTPCYTQKYPGYLSYKPSYSRFCPEFFSEVDIRDVITCFKFGDDRFRGLASAEGQILPFPIDFDGRPYNTLTLPCERVISLRTLLAMCTASFI